MRACIFFLLTVLLSASCACAAGKLPRHSPPGGVNFPDDSVSIVTASPSAMSGQDGARIAELARVYDAAGLPRVLPVTGLGPIANARDLLHMRGIDMAVLNADIQAYAKLDGGLPGFATRLVQVLKLADKSVYVLAGQDVNSLAELNGQVVLSIGQDSDGHVTARTLFALLNIPIRLEAADLPGALKALAGKSAKALVLVTTANDFSLARLPRDSGLHLLAAPPSVALDDVYQRATITEAEAPGLVPEGGLPSLRVASLLTTYSWRPNLYRYGPVQQFLRALPQAIADLRTHDSAGFWQATDARIGAPGWLAFDGSPIALASVAPTADPSPALATVAVAPAPVTVPKPVEAPAKPLAGGVDLIAHPVAGLASAEAASGGLFAEIVRASLSREQLRLNWVANADEAARKIDSGAGPRLGLAWVRPDCDAPAGKALCDRFVFSKPVFQALDVFFVRHGSDFKFQRDEEVAGRTVCAAADADITALDSPERHWLKQDMITLLRKPALADCLSALDHGDVEAVFGDQLDGQQRIEAVGLAGRIEVVDRPVGLRELAVAAAKSDPDAAQLIGRLEAGLISLKADGRYAAMVLSRMRHVEVLGAQ